MVYELSLKTLGTLRWFTTWVIPAPTSPDITEFTYDSDGSRVKKASNGVTTVYIGELYEKTGSLTTKHIYLGANKVVSKNSADTLYYHSDHLGSSNVITNASGAQAQLSEYKPFGELSQKLGDASGFRLSVRFSLFLRLLLVEGGFFMPRIRRFMPVNSALHIMCRGNNRQNIFNSDSDKLYYWRLLNELSRENKLGILHYCIMDNHVHLVVWITQESKLSKFMKQINLSYYNYYKKLYGYWGHVWQGRYKSNVIENDAYLLYCGKYIELNPARAGIVNSPSEYSFSSYRHYAFGLVDAAVSDSPAFLGLSQYPAKRKELYIAFVVDSSIINSNILARQTFIGSKDFIRRLRQYYGIKETNFKGGRPRKEKPRSVP